MWLKFNLRKIGNNPFKFELVCIDYHKSKNKSKIQKMNTAIYFKLRLFINVV